MSTAHRINGAARKASIALAPVALVLGLVAAARADTTTRDGLIAFQRPGSKGVYDIWVVRPDGSGLRRLTTSPRDHADYDPNWSPDGSTVLFSRQVLTKEAGDDLFTVSPRGGSLHQLTDCHGDCWSDGEARFSRDGRRIALVRATGPQPAAFPAKVAVYVAKVDGTDARQLSRPPNGFEDHNPDWSPDGKTIVFRRENRTTQATRIMAIDTATGDERTVYVLPHWAPGAGSPTVSPDGNRLLFGFWCPWSDQCHGQPFQMRNSRLATIRTDGTGLRKIPLELRADSAAWSPTGGQIVFRCHAVAWQNPTTPFKLCTSRVDGGHLRQLRWPVESAHPSWGSAR